MPYLDDARWRDLIDTRAEQPQLALEKLRTRRRRPLLTDGRLFIAALTSLTIATSCTTATASCQVSGTSDSRMRAIEMRVECMVRAAGCAPGAMSLHETGGPGSAGPGMPPRAFGHAGACRHQNRNARLKRTLRGP